MHTRCTHTRCTLFAHRCAPHGAYYGMVPALRRGTTVGHWKNVTTTNNNGDDVLTGSSGREGDGSISVTTTVRAPCGASSVEPIPLIHGYKDGCVYSRCLRVVTLPASCGRSLPPICLYVPASQCSYHIIHLRDSTTCSLYAAASDDASSSAYTRRAPYRGILLQRLRHAALPLPMFLAGFFRRASADISATASATLIPRWAGTSVPDVGVSWRFIYDAQRPDRRFSGTSGTSLWVSLARNMTLTIGLIAAKGSHRRYLSCDSS